VAVPSYYAYDEVAHTNRSPGHQSRLPVGYSAARQLRYA